MKEAAKFVLLVLATVLVTPLLAMYWLQAWLMDRNRALRSCSQTISLVPGLTGQFLRRAFYVRVLANCHPSATVEFGTIFSQWEVRLGKNVYIGPMCHIGQADIGDEVLIASGVHIPSGQLTHGTSDLTRPIREQPGRLQTVRIGANTWIGSAAIVMADVGENCVIMAGSVVDNPIPPRVIAGGTPARLIQSREYQVG